MNGEVIEIGTLYNKVFKEVTGNKTHNKGKKYQIWSYIIEVKRRKEWTEQKDDRTLERNTTKSVLVKVKILMGMNPDDYMIGDHIIITYYTEGKEWEKKDGTGKDVFNETVMKSIKFAPIQNGETDSRHSPEREKVFVTPQNQDKSNTEDNEDDLPF